MAAEFWFQEEIALAGPALAGVIKGLRGLDPAATATAGATSESLSQEEREAHRSVYAPGAARQARGLPAAGQAWGGRGRGVGLRAAGRRSGTQRRSAMLSTAGVTGGRPQGLLSSVPWWPSI